MSYLIAEAGLHGLELGPLGEDVCCALQHEVSARDKAHEKGRQNKNLHFVCTERRKQNFCHRKKGRGKKVVLAGESRIN